MQRRIIRIWMWLALFVGGATVFQTIGFTTKSGAISGGCRDFALNGVTSAVDMCYLFDCKSGFFGGLIDPCASPTPLLDCPNAGGTTTQTNGTATGMGMMGG